MSILFTPAHIKKMTIRNRFVRSATYEGLGTREWRPGKKLISLYCELADAEIGLIITGGTLARRFRGLSENEEGSYPLAMDRDEICSDWRTIAEAIHERGSRIVMQISYMDRWESPPASNTNIFPSIHPSQRVGKIMPSDLTTDEIRIIVEEYAQAARRTFQAGFDGVQLHGGHGFFISRFLSPNLNSRSDRYGGTPERRSTIIVEMVKRIRELVGTDYPVLIKMNCDDFVPGGLIIEDAVQIAEKIVEAGIDCIEVTGGVPDNRQYLRSLELDMLKNPSDERAEAYFRPLGAAIKGAVDVPVILVGGMRTPRVMERTIETDSADFVSLSRPLIREPQLVRRWKSGDLSKATCISCNQCLNNAFRRPLQCYSNKRE